MKWNLTDVITLTNSEFRFIVAEQIEEINMRPGPILIEPSSKIQLLLS